MKVCIRTEGHRFTIPVPLSVMPTLLKIAYKFTDMDMSYKETAIELCHALKRAHRDFRGLELVHVRDSDGDEVIVIL